MNSTWLLAIALASGLILGLERGWSQAPDDSMSPGARTFTLTALLGGGLAMAGITVAALGLVLVGAFAIVGWQATSKSSSDLGYTTEIALLMSYGCGVLAGLGQPGLAISLSIVSALTLGLKTEVHGFVHHLKRLEVLSTILRVQCHVPVWQAINPWIDGHE